MSRLNLRFDDENEQEFEKRVLEAKKYKEEAVQSIYFNYFVTNNINYKEPNLPTRVIQSILEFVQSANKVLLNNYRNNLVYYKLPADMLHNPIRFL